MQEFIADKELSDADHIPETASVYDMSPVQESGVSVDAVDATNDGKREEGNPKRTYEKGAHLRFDGPVSRLCSLERGAAYIGLTKTALRAAISRGQMPGHKTRSNPEDEKSDGTWWFNAKEWDALADELPEIEPPEWHHWKDYWTYSRRAKKFQKVSKEDCLKIGGRRVYKSRKSKLEQANNS
ncbi:transcriptional regulator [Salmonella enterica]|uniref:Transcriptional regulator n=1 Tax=Salmonella newport TaxID=108619 RepID=A0A5X8XW74_SALNE|nr:transcriptional regulator [Salmonella enterica]EBV0463059.1 transcriptional regulator [Salmonella enterica subsp. enterica serovar Newport]EBW9463787.1 transcriptional regulator [Salmonella enterica subsp. enterica serovar Panama]ECC9075870.1 transcriptional regulator [Salmonella enterica subsp. enterica]EBX1210932.1 transcriptional regulator [Salmonella enterica subsp. enterica serovar Newport]